MLPQVGLGFRPVGDERLLSALADAVPELTLEARFVWMDTATPAPGGAGVAWLADADLAEVGALLDRAAPESYARPGGTGVRRWAGWRDPGGALLAVAADAWSAPEVGFLAGVATDPPARGRGLAGAVCAFVTNALLAEHGRVGLMVDDWNTGALAVYRRLGFRLRRIAAARLD
jgi:ribosomal protein S18 acetylase RimI-like enzyme